MLDEAADGSKNAGEEPGMGRHRRLPLLDSPFLQKVCFASKISVKELCELLFKKMFMWNGSPSGMGSRILIISCPTELPYRTALQRCPTELPYRTALQNYPTHLHYRTALKNCPTELSYRAGLA